jgi:hypothetical protein
MLNTVSTRGLLAGALVVAFALAACSSGTGAPSSTPGGVATPRPTLTAVPGDSGGSGNGIGTDPDSGGGSDGSDGHNDGGGLVPIRGGPNDNPPNDNPLLGNATYLKPVLGLVNQRTVNVQFVRAAVNADGSATADLRWWSGVAPCSALDHVEMTRDDAAKAIRLKVIEGSGAGDVACIEIAQLSATLVDLGTLASGTWTISAEGDAPAIPLDVP